MQGGKHRNHGYIGGPSHLLAGLLPLAQRPLPAAGIYLGGTDENPEYPGAEPCQSQICRQCILRSEKRRHLGLRPAAISNRAQPLLSGGPGDAPPASNHGLRFQAPEQWYAGVAIRSRRERKSVRILSLQHLETACFSKKIWYNLLDSGITHRNTGVQISNRKGGSL